VTVILGLRCAEGLVLATDSQATAQMPGGIPIKLGGASKLQQLGDSILFAGTGAQGCSQRVDQILNGNIGEFDPSKPKSELGQLVHQCANHVQRASRDAYVQYAQGAQMESWGGIFCGRSSDGLWMAEVDLNGGWQFHDNVAATGSGYALAFHAVATVQHHSVHTAPLAAAKALAYRAIESTCLISAFGVGLPVQLGVVTNDGVSRLGTAEMDEVSDLVNLWKALEIGALGAALAPAPAGEQPTAAEAEDEDEDEPGLDAPGDESEAGAS
jgi:20S proteasome alpha/beta subunit